MNQTFTLTLSLDQVNAVLAALQELPAKIANPMTEEIRNQAMAQVPKADAEVLNAE